MTSDNAMPEQGPHEFLGQHLTKYQQGLLVAGRNTHGTNKHAEGAAAAKDSRSGHTFEVIDPDGAAAWERGRVQDIVHIVMCEAYVPGDIPVTCTRLLILLPPFPHHASLRPPGN